MKDLRDISIDRFRIRTKAVLDRFGSFGGATEGMFTVVPPGHLTPLHVIAASGDGWDHVSVSGPGRTPTWSEMEAIKRLFFKDDELAMQLHLPPKEHINCHPHVLHIWRPLQAAIPQPPPYMV